jgi:hypothetical protein
MNDDDTRTKWCNTIREMHDRRILAEHHNGEDRRAVQAANGVDPGPVYGSLEVRIVEGSPIAWAAAALREIATALEKGG